MWRCLGLGALVIVGLWGVMWSGGQRAYVVFFLQRGVYIDSWHENIRAKMEEGKEWGMDGGAEIGRAHV